MSETAVWAVVLAGGVGSRFWPASTPENPKQLLPLASDRPLLRDTVDRITPLVPTQRLRILTGAHLAEGITGAVPELTPAHLWIEPRPVGTGPALAYAAARIAAEDPEAVMISLHADAAVDNAKAFLGDLERAIRLARRHRRLVTVGVPPDRPETGYGYIRLGDALPGDGDQPDGFEVAAFVEKPDQPTAERYLADGGYLWNSGLFVWRVMDLLDELRAHTPELAELLPLAERGDADAFFGRAPTLSIDEGVLERSKRVAVVKASFGWDDVGSWDALFRTRRPDASGNVTVGEAHAVEASGNALYSDDGPVVAFGVENLVVVRANGVTFVSRRALAPELKRLLGHLPKHLGSPNTSPPEDD